MATEEPSAPSGDRFAVHREHAPFADRSLAEIFTGGTVEVRPLPELAAAIDRMREQPVQTSIVRFSPGARTVPHVHSGDQILIVFEGEGTIGHDPAPVSVRAGDVVVVAADTVHVHASSPERGLTHLSVLFGNTDLTAGGAS